MLLIPTLLCPKAWENMSGDETRRFCSYCQKHVHNLAALSASERLALLSSPAGSICSRYQVAIRRPAQGKEEPYLRHLAKYGAGVALVGSVLLVLWEMQGEAEQQKFYRAAAHRPGCAMPGELYVERRGLLVGDVMVRPPPAAGSEPGPPEADPARPVDLRLDPAELDRLLKPLDSGIPPLQRPQ